jgi:hypothetical protein
MKKNDGAERNTMNNKFDELTKGIAESVTRRQALKKFSVGLAGMALGFFGLAKPAHGQSGYCTGSYFNDGSFRLDGFCGKCNVGPTDVSPDCPRNAPASATNICYSSTGFPFRISSIRCHI